MVNYAQAPDLEQVKMLPSAVAFELVEKQAYYYNNYFVVFVK